MDFATLQNEITLRVRYGETDQMGYVYYGNYTQYYEVGRVELLRSLGISYRQLEDSGIMLPVLDLQVKYIKPAMYDDVLKVITRLPAMPVTRIFFEYEIINSVGELLNTAKTTLVFVNKITMRPCKAPDALVAAISAAADNKK